MPLIELTDVRLYYRVTGNGPAVLLIPGLGQIAGAWDPIVPELAEHFSVIQIDNRGIGQSVELRPARRIDDYVSDFVELLDALQVDRAHVIGISFGGVLAQRVAADHPSRVDRLVLISTTGRAHPYLKHVGMLLGHALRHFPMKMFFETVELLGTSPEHFDAHESEISQMIQTRAAARKSRRVLANQLRILASTANANPDRKITAPTLVLTGEYDSLIPNCYGRQIAEGLEHGRFQVIPNCGHNPVLEQPAQAIEAILEFLNEPSQRLARGLEFVSNGIR